MHDIYYMTNKQDILKSKDLLPQDDSVDWFNESESNELKNCGMLRIIDEKIGFTEVLQKLKDPKLNVGSVPNPNYCEKVRPRDIDTERAKMFYFHMKERNIPIVPKNVVGPWMNSSCEPDIILKPIDDTKTTEDKKALELHTTYSGLGLNTIHSRLGSCDINIDPTKIPNPKCVASPWLKEFPMKPIEKFPEPKTIVRPWSEICKDAEGIGKLCV